MHTPGVEHAGPDRSKGPDKMRKLKPGVKCHFTVPDKLMADGAKCGLWEEGGGELMALDVVDFGLFDGPSAVMQSKEAFSLKLTHVLCVCRNRTRDKVGGGGMGRGGKDGDRQVIRQALKPVKSQALIKVGIALSFFNSVIQNYPRLYYYTVETMGLDSWLNPSLLADCAELSSFGF